MPETSMAAARSRRAFNPCEVCSRVEAEYWEMPGLRLTVAQAARLFDLDPVECEQILTTLVRSGQLATDGRTFARRRR